MANANVAEEEKKVVDEEQKETQETEPKKEETKVKKGKAKKILAIVGGVFAVIGAVVGSFLFGNSRGKKYSEAKRPELPDHEPANDSVPYAEDADFVEVE